jgi:hypothetical protein
MGIASFTGDGLDTSVFWLSHVLPVSIFGVITFSCVTVFFFCRYRQTHPKYTAASWLAIYKNASAMGF